MVARVVWDAGIGDVDGHPLGADGIPAARLADADHHIGPLLFHSLPHSFDGSAKDTRHDAAHHLGASHLLGQPFHDLLGRVHCLAAKRLKTCDQYLHVSFLLEMTLLLMPVYHLDGPPTTDLPLLFTGGMTLRDGTARWKRS